MVSDDQPESRLVDDQGDLLHFGGDDDASDDAAIPAGSSQTLEELLAEAADAAARETSEALAAVAAASAPLGVAVDGAAVAATVPEALLLGRQTSLARQQAEHRALALRRAVNRYALELPLIGLALEHSLTQDAYRDFVTTLQLLSRQGLLTSERVAELSLMPAALKHLRVVANLDTMVMPVIVPFESQPPLPVETLYAHYFPVLDLTKQFLTDPENGGIELNYLPGIPSLSHNDAQPYGLPWDSAATRILLSAVSARYAVQLQAVNQRSSGTRFVLLPMLLSVAIDDTNTGSMKNSSVLAVHVRFNNLERDRINTRVGCALLALLPRTSAKYNSDPRVNNARWTFGQNVFRHLFSELCSVTDPAVIFPRDNAGHTTVNTHYLLRREQITLAMNDGPAPGADIANTTYVIVPVTSAFTLDYMGQLELANLSRNQCVYCDVPSDELASTHGEPYTPRDFDVAVSGYSILINPGSSSQEQADTAAALRGAGYRSAVVPAFLAFSVSLTDPIACLSFFNAFHLDSMHLFLLGIAKSALEYLQKLMDSQYAHKLGRAVFEARLKKQPNFDDGYRHRRKFGDGLFSGSMFLTADNIGDALSAVAASIGFDKAVITSATTRDRVLSTFEALHRVENMLREPALSDDDLVRLQTLVNEVSAGMQAVFPHAGSEKVGYNYPKWHVFNQHLVADIKLHGAPSQHSAQWAEAAHKFHIKRGIHNTNSLSGAHGMEHQLAMRNAIVNFSKTRLPHLLENALPAPREDVEYRFLAGKREALSEYDQGDSVIRKADLAGFEHAWHDCAARWLADYDVSKHALTPGDVTQYNTCRIQVLSAPSCRAVIHGGYCAVASIATDAGKALVIPVAWFAVPEGSEAGKDFVKTFGCAAPADGEPRVPDYLSFMLARRVTPQIGVGSNTLKYHKIHTVDYTELGLIIHPIRVLLGVARWLHVFDCHHIAAAPQVHVAAEVGDSTDGAAGNAKPVVRVLLSETLH